MLLKRFFLILTFVISFSTKSQTNLNLGWRVGLAFDVGTHVNRFGISLGGFLNYSHLMTDAMVTAYYNFQAFGTKMKTPEIQLGISSSFVFGDKDSTQTIRYGLNENNSVYANSIGYAYLHYWDKNMTSQGNGQLKFQYQAFRFLIANDLFGSGKGWRDRFRTGAFGIDYTYNEFRFGISTQIWTGDFVGCEIVKNDSLYPHAKMGYRMQEGSTYGNHSFGILSVNASYILPIPYLQHSVHLNTGIDSEKLRNGLQNRFIHNQRFIPDKLKKDVPHIPMLANDGSFYLYRTNQEIKTLHYYFKLGVNSPEFY